MPSMEGEVRHGHCVWLRHTALLLYRQPGQETATFIVGLVAQRETIFRTQAEGALVPETPSFWRSRSLHPLRGAAEEESKEQALKDPGKHEDEAPTKQEQHKR